METPQDQAPDEGSERPVFLTPLHPLRWRDPWRWLALGWRDLWRAPAISLIFGVLFLLMGWALMAVFRHAPAYTLALSAGFLLMGPFLCLGLYQVSLRLERGQVPDLGEAMTAWSDHLGQMAIFGGALLVLEMIWARAALVIFAVSFEGMPDFAGAPGQLLAPENLGFLAAYLGVGALFAGLIFALSVIAMPMMLEREVDAISAALVSLRLCLSQPGVMLSWGALITLLVALALLPWFVGLVIVGPWLGHASWHAYRAAVTE